MSVRVSANVSDNKQEFIISDKPNLIFRCIDAHAQKWTSNGMLLNTEAVKFT